MTTTYKNNRSSRRSRRGNQQTTISSSKTNSLGVIDRGIPLFPARFKARLTYHENFELKSGASIAGNYIFTANGLFDPNITSTGHQPMGFDQMMLSYEHYTVTQAKIELLCRSTSTTSAVVGIRMNPDNVGITNVDTIRESGSSVIAQLGIASNPTSSALLETKVNLAKFLGIPDLLDSSIARGSLIANPTEQAYFNIFVYNVEDTATIQIWCDVIIHYDAVFTEPRTLPLSARKAMLEKMKDEARQSLNIKVDDAKRDDFVSVTRCKCACVTGIG